MLGSWRCEAAKVLVKMNQKVFNSMVWILLSVSTSESLPQWTNQRLVFTVFEANQTWNEAREICRNNGRWLLSMEEKNAWTMWKLLMDPSAGLPHRPYDVRYWMDVHARDLQNMSNLYHDDCSRVTYVEWELDTDQRLNYVVEKPCLAFDAYWRPFTATLLKLWLGLPCQENHYFICITPMDDLLCVDTCHESVYLFPNTALECQALCVSLGSGCNSRFLSLDDFTVCHIVKANPATSDSSYNICYFPQLLGGLQWCTSPVSFDLNFTINDQPDVMDLCAEADTTTQYATTEQNSDSTTEQSTIQEATPEKHSTQQSNDVTTEKLTTQTTTQQQQQYNTQQSSDSTTEQSTTQEQHSTQQSNDPTTEQTQTQQTEQTTTNIVQTTGGYKVMTTEPVLATTSSVLCECPCSIVANISDPLLTIEEKVERLKKELTVNKRNTSSHRRSLISVADHRVSATSIGSMGVVILSVVLGSICLLDLTTVRCGVIAQKYCKRKSKKISDRGDNCKAKIKDENPNLKLNELVKT